MTTGDQGPTPAESHGRRGKSESAFRTIGEVSEELDLPQHVLRFWESKFPQIKPLKRGGGRRYYRPEDVETLRRVRDLLYKDGYTIRGVQKLLREQARGDVAATATLALEPPPASTHPIPAPETDETDAPDSEIEAEADSEPTDEPAPVVETASPVDDREALRATLRSVLDELRDLRALLDAAQRQDA